MSTENLVVNGHFDEGFDGWHPSDTRRGYCCIKNSPLVGNYAQVPAGGSPTTLSQSTTLGQGEYTLTFKTGPIGKNCSLRVMAVPPGSKTYTFLAFPNLAINPDDNAWKDNTCTFTVPEGYQNLYFEFYATYSTTLTVTDVKLVRNDA